MCRGKRNHLIAGPNGGNMQNPLIHGQYSPSKLRRSEAQSFCESKTRNNGSALALRIKRRTIVFWGENPGFACKPQNSPGADEVIQQGKVPEGITSSYFKRGKSQHIPKRIGWKS